MVEELLVARWGAMFICLLLNSSWQLSLFIGLMNVKTVFRTSKGWGGRVEPAGYIASLAAAFFGKAAWSSSFAQQI